ncbi:calmodulin-lysine N-methyltransferase isoform X1 [Tribolium castaneum]|uniref:Calmodulin-lysine N-methyltransferase n=1 Tax=Tribolium castaneum TaxID=7070 RepID=D6X0H7_TRICA|nr:PREDICTED: calmodulin-lysine N-methyltransferase isoform X1 [Tribolium castaneum]EFA09570.1 Calmodulin-lysine N-methyltransferase-like Protein [Tribolium castaneum]|eukprot:XP_971600.1 PREDICTED: calmodulin-lysine N-methyltransferase isoform X1 [Tribolium castaneum]
MDQKDLVVVKNEAKKVARRRWAILAKALKSPVGSEPSSPTDEFSLRRISSFMLLQTQQLRPHDHKRTWYSYSIRIGLSEYSIVIGHRIRTFSAEDLMGFNNTGNICIWPSEETLSYYVCSNLAQFADKTILELGGGMSCLAGLFAAKYAAPKAVTVTDGNKHSVENVQAALDYNQFACPVDCKLLKWGSHEGPLYDVILCADCLFFDDARADLIECLWGCLDARGVAFVMAPKRGGTLDHFIAQSEIKGFKCRKIVNYNQVVWEKRLALIEHCEYDDDIHYPILIEVTKV